MPIVSHITNIEGIVISMQTEDTRVRFIDRELRKIEVERGQIVLSYPLNAIPDSLYKKIAGLLVVMNPRQQIFAQSIQIQ